MGKGVSAVSTRPCARKRMRLRLLKWDAHVCCYCAIPLTPATATLEHLQPLSRGGKHTRENCRLACEPCNSRRGTMDPVEFRQHVRNGGFPERLRGGFSPTTPFAK